MVLAGVIDHLEDAACQLAQHSDLGRMKERPVAIASLVPHVIDFEFDS
jgi:hypothetical protein